MQNSQTPWLCQYNDYVLFPNFVIRLSYPEILDAVLNFKMENHIVSYDSDLDKKMTDDFLTLMENIHEGEYIEKKYMPTKAYLLPNEELPPSNVPMFRASSGIFLVNQSVYDVFCKHNLGQTHFSQVYIYDILTEQQICDKPYYFINVAERRQYLDIKVSKGIEEYDFIDNYPQRKIYNPKDGDILLNKESLLCDTDIWHESILDYSLFFSNKLVQSLFEIGIKREDFGLVQCGLV